MKVNFELILRIILAGILLQTLFFKFIGAPESIYIFSTLGIEPWGRIGSGIAELIAALMLLHPRFIGFGGAMAAGIMFGAIVSHLAVLGIEVQNDGGLLFGLACIVFIGSIFLAWKHRQTIPFIGIHLPGKNFK
ncbi:MAG: DoxX family protein [bacterium]|nr:DoxX family protein [bacterium]